MTKRDLFFENVQLYQNQQMVNAATDEIFQILKVRLMHEIIDGSLEFCRKNSNNCSFCSLKAKPIQLPFVASAKGLKTVAKSMPLCPSWEKT